MFRRNAVSSTLAPYVTGFSSATPGNRADVLGAGPARVRSKRRERPRLAFGRGVTWNVWLPAIIYLAAIALGESLTEAVDPRAGIIAHAALLSALIVHASLTSDQRVYRLLVPLCLAPLIRILSLSMPLGQISIVYWYAIIAVPLLTAAVLVAQTLKLSRAELGLTLRHPLLQVAICVAGLTFGMAEYLILRPEPLAASFTLKAVALPAMILLVATGFAEEFIFRGVMQSASRNALGGWNILYVSAIFALLHLGYQSALDVAFVFAVGGLFAVVARQTGSIIGVTLSHGLTNITLFLIAPFFLA